MWISIKNRLPKEKQLVDVFTTSNKFDLINGRITEVFRIGKRWKTKCLGFYVDRVSHWSPIPQPPSYNKPHAGSFGKGIK